MHNYFKAGLLSVLIFCSCSSETKNDPKQQSEEKQQAVDTTEPAPTMTWIDVQEKVSTMNEETKYDEIVKLLGQPYDEYITPSLESEYILFYNVPGVRGAIFWIMVDSESKKFLYWSGETAEKIRVKTH